MVKFTLKCLLANGVHIGHSRKFTSSLFERYLFGYRHQISLIDVQQSSLMLRRGLAFITDVIASRGVVLVVERLFRNVDKTFYGQLSVKRGWIAGGLTNMSNLRTNFSTSSFKCLPSAVVFLTEDKNKYYFFNEAKKLGIPSVGVIDSNMFPGLASFPIVGNNDMVGTTSFYISLFRRAILAGYLKEKLRFVGR